MTLPAPEIQTVTSWKVACDGDEARGLGHPRVWLAIPRDAGWVECGYCDKRFEIDRAHVVGASMGGMIAQVFAARHQHRR